MSRDRESEGEREERNEKNDDSDKKQVINAKE